MIEEFILFKNYKNEIWCDHEYSEKVRDLTDMNGKYMYRSEWSFD